jgi:beta-lactamase superfamily II metal-dependent hydrolase
MEIAVLGIGKADAIIITTENHTAMIDAGENNDGGGIIDYLLNNNIHTIDYLILTHYHKDHIGGAHAVINNLEVKEVIAPDYGKESKHYDRFINAAINAGLEILVLKETLEFTLDNAEFTVYPPKSPYFHYDYDDDDLDDDDENDEADITNENNYSIAVSVKHGENNFLFTGDAKSKRLKELLSERDIIFTDYDFLKVPHHGNYNKRSTEFINFISPEYAVITCSLKNMPDGRVISALENTGAEIYLTADGDVHCKSDGKKIIIEQKNSVEE